MTSVHLEWTGPALSGASGGTWQGVALLVSSDDWTYVGSYGRQATLIIEDVGPWKDLNDDGRTATELKNSERLESRVTDLSGRIEELEGS